MNIKLWYYCEVKYASPLNKIRFLIVDIPILLVKCPENLLAVIFTFAPFPQYILTMINIVNNLVSASVALCKSGIQWRSVTREGSVTANHGSTTHQILQP